MGCRQNTRNFTENFKNLDLAEIQLHSLAHTWHQNDKSSVYHISFFCLKFHLIKLFWRPVKIWGNISPHTLINWVFSSRFFRLSKTRNLNSSNTIILGQISTKQGLKYALKCASQKHIIVFYQVRSMINTVNVWNTIFCLLVIHRNSFVVLIDITCTQESNYRFNQNKPSGA